MHLHNIVALGKLIADHIIHHAAQGYPSPPFRAGCNRKHGRPLESVSVPTAQSV